MVRIITKTFYVTESGREFDDEKEAIKFETMKALTSILLGKDSEGNSELGYQKEFDIEEASWRLIGSSKEVIELLQLYDMEEFND